MGNNTDRPEHGSSADSKGQGQGNGNGKGKTDACPDAAGTDARGNKDEKAPTHQKLKLREETNSFFYDGMSLDLLKEYKDLSAAKAEYYYANGQVIGRKMFGLRRPVHGRGRPVQHDGPDREDL